MTLDVSIIVPVYNCELYITNCMESILKQTYSNIEIIIINDGSTDNTEKVIKDYLLMDERVKYLYQKNSGPSMARNLGIEAASGKYLVFVDADDTIEKKYVEQLYQKMIVSDADLVCCGYKDISKYGIIEHSDFKFENTQSIHLMMKMVCQGTGGVLWGKMFKKDQVQVNNLKMNQDLFMNEDLIFVLEYVSLSKSFSALEEYLYNYNRMNEKSITANLDISYTNNFISVCILLEKILDRTNFETTEKDKIILRKIQDFVINIVNQQSNDLKNIGLVKAVRNIKQVVQIYYINSKVNEFSTQLYFEKPYIYLLKKRFILPVLFYSQLINALKKINNNLIRKKVVL
ncbi:glycosyltransferase family 2 protein [Jeotgalibacillus sp. S-D1]|uniref:glycosyltransferase family 2 protein n=1 Tax=Jeotgalibacillus sp. S-D1 TaxID=2552189 RepID=UPI0010597F4C|nr:glycosyltransferase family 2 protein [Jeotgalibacillus sp. S-D1]TDL31815.1 glycosyltransferase family 2 protein [Jeotgalibacillus sp. S-D1]